MASARDFAAGFLTVAAGLVAPALGGAPETCSGTLQLSCHNTTKQTNTCCFNTPGGSLLQTQFWDTDPSEGPSDSWTIHGLWPDHCDGTYDEDCDSSRAYTNITEILEAFGETDLLSYMDTFWLSNDESNEDFWEHEWATHGTCVSTLDPACFADYQPTEEVPYFFNTTVTLFQSLPTYDWLSAAGITPSSSATYKLSAIQSALSAQHGGESVYLGCDDDELYQVYYYFNVYGSVADGEFVPTSPDDGDTGNCPSTGVKYLPKSGESPAPTTTYVGTVTPTGTPTGATTTTGKKTSTKTTSATSTATATGTFSGKGYLNAVTGGSTEGCIISGGTWYTTGTCATFTATPDSSGFTLSSSKGDCEIADGTLTCSSSVDSGYLFSASGSDLISSGDSTTWYADGVPSGSDQGTVYSASSKKASTTLTIEWQSV
ncbi:ribonuclease M [Xylariaceae sp. FL0804]|nr:ribonuclease M [Xylariaceae sp. FL0804]